MRFRTEADFLDFVNRGQRAQEAADALTKPKPRRAHPEDDLQRAVCDFWAHAYPDTWSKTFHCPNGIAARNRKLAGIFKGLGMKAGVFDLLCIAKRGPFNGLALELKAPSGVISPDQLNWYDHFVREGWHAVIAFDFETAQEALKVYHART